MTDEPFKFELSLSILNHLGRNLYRNFITILGEAISNSWDADAKNVYITIDKDKDTLVIKDDGIGMTADDFQKKFLKIGYSKRKNEKKELVTTSALGRAFIGAKGVGKLALLSCSKRVTIISKTAETDIIGGEIDNGKLDDAIEDDVLTSKYNLDKFNIDAVALAGGDFKNGTIIIFDDMNSGIQNTPEYIRQQIAMHFRFALLDEDFKIYVNEKEVTFSDLKYTYDETQFLWSINGYTDVVYESFPNLKKWENLTSGLSFKGFIASVSKPSFLKVRGLEERMGVDLFVNGRLRQRDILSQIPTARIVESYLHGQIFFDEIDSGNNDPFTTSREGIKSDDEKFAKLLKKIQQDIIQKVFSRWDKWRLEGHQDGDDEDSRVSRKERKAKSLLNLELEDYSESLKGNKTLGKWIKDIRENAEFYIPSYVRIYLSENLIRKYIKHKNLTIHRKHIKTAQKWRVISQDNCKTANVNYPIREDADLSYLSMETLAEIVDGKIQTKKPGLPHDALQFKPPRDTIAHTAILNERGKKLLEKTYVNIVHRLNDLLKLVK